MGKIAFIFSGQGDQYPGMGRELCERYPQAQEVFDICESLRPDTRRQCFEGTAEELKQTVNTQPCLFAYELAAVAALCAEGITPDAVAGFSLGELAACVAAGRVELATGFSLVCRRGELMQRAAEAVDTSMAAVIKLSAETVEALCSAEEGVYPVNYNCPGQITVAGRSDRMPALMAAVKAAGGRAIPLAVGGGFHSPFMQKASEAFAEELAKVTFRRGELPLYANVTARPYGDDTAALLAKQIASPVRWEESVRHMIEDGVDTVIEVGPGKTLVGMVGRIDPQIRRYAVCEWETLLAEVKGC